jgi:F0F1-type ATP synthase membrane subunit b/b'
MERSTETMSEFIIVAQIALIVVMYVLIMNQVVKMYDKYKEDSATSIIETIDDEGNLTVIEKRKYL